MKKALWWILAVLLSPILLFIILTVLLYLPPIQNWAVDKVTAIASEKTGMDISVGHVNLSFPLDLGIDQFRVIQHPDTIADVERLVVDVQLLPLFSSRVVINELEINNTSLNTANFVEAARVKGHVQRLFVSSHGIDLDKQTAEVNGARLEHANLDIQLNDSVPEDTTKTEVPWVIHADELKIKQTDLMLRMPGDTMTVATHFGTLAVKEAVIDLATETYAVGSVDWLNGAVQYDLTTLEERLKGIQTAAEGLDFNHISLTNINVGIDSIYYHDPTMRLHMRTLALREKSGLKVTDLTGPVVMENGSLQLPKFHLQTPYSQLNVELDLPFSLTDSINPGKMRLRMNSSLGKADLMPFMATLPKAFQERWPDSPLTIGGLITGNMQRMEFHDADITLPSAFHATASGFAANLDKPELLRADVDFHAETQNLGFVMAMLPRDMQRNYRIPAGIRADGNVKADGANYIANITAREGNGIVKAAGSFNANAMRYDAKLNVRNLNIHHFMPRDSIYTITADVTAKGQGTDFLSPNTRLTADAKVSHLRYGQWNLDNITAQAQIGNGHAQVDVLSNNSLVDGRINLDALLNRKNLNATIVADVNKVDLYKMQLVDNPLSIALCGHADVTSDMKMSNYVSGLISDLIVRDSVKAVRSEFVGLHIRTTQDTTLVRAQSGDFIIKLDASGNYEQLAKQLTALADTMTHQYENRLIDQFALKRQLPTMKFHVESKRENPLLTILKSQDIEFKQMLFDISTSPQSGLNGNGHIYSLTASGVRLDTITFRLTHNEKRLSFGGKIRNNKKNPQFVFNALFDGILQERGATFGVRYFDAAGKMGARIGAQAEMVDSGLRMHLVPEQPTLGYKLFNLNKDNYLLFSRSGKVKAKIDMVADDRMGVKIYSEESDSTALQDITVSLNRLNLEELTSVIPYAPRMTGLMNGDYHIIQNAARQFSVASDMSVQNMTYERNPIGNISTEMVYLQKGDSAHAVEARLMKDDVEIGLLTGTYYNTTPEGSLDAQVLLTHTPLSLVNGFVPDQIVGLEGYGDGELTVKGRLSSPQVNGKLLLAESRLVSIPYGVTLRFNNDSVRIVDSNLLFDNFIIYSQHNNSPMTVQGNVNFSNTEKIQVSLRLRAKNYQIVGAKENTKSVAYGKAFVNVFAYINGLLDNLNLRGRLDVLPSTDLYYILRDSPLTTDNQIDELVKFTDFSDTARVVVERPSINGLRMDMTLNVTNGSHIKAWLNTDHSNYIDLMGGGTLRMQYNPADNMQLTGRYSLSNGEMKYSLPVIPLKTFTIKDGSYVEFTGDMMNPTLNITAMERTKSTVTGSTGVGRTVEFDCGVIITKTLNNMGLEFTLDAPEDMQLHSELQAMSMEQRGKLAVAMLTTGIYLDDGNTQDFSMNSALSSFLNSEINSITGNALRTLDLSFGMDNATDATGQTRTDYSFKFAKRFLNNRLRLSVGGKVSTGAVTPDRNNSFFDNVSLEYRLDNNATKYVNLFFQNNSYDWLDGYTQKYGGGFIWRRTVQHLTDIFRRSSTLTPTMQRNIAQPVKTDSTRTSAKTDSTLNSVKTDSTRTSVKTDSTPTKNHAK